MANTTLTLSHQQSAVSEFRDLAEQVAFGISDALSIVVSAQAALESKRDDEVPLSVTQMFNLVGLCQVSAALLAEKAGRLAEGGRV
jgi:hypothetical protein